MHESLGERKEDLSYSNKGKPDTERFSVRQDPGSNSSATSGTIQTLKR